LGLGKVEITRRTHAEDREKLVSIVGSETAGLVLWRDCELTRYAFCKTFQELYQQQDLIVGRTHSEAEQFLDRSFLVDSSNLLETELFESTSHSSAENNSHNVDKSVYLITPKTSYRNASVNGVLAIGRFLRHWVLPWWENYELRKENQALKEEGFERDVIIKKYTEAISTKNVQLTKRQDTITSLLSTLTRMRTSSEKHAWAGIVAKVLEDTRGLLISQMSNLIPFYYSHYEQAGNELACSYLAQACAPFGVTPEVIYDPKKLESILREVDLREFSSVEDKSAVIEEKEIFGDEGPFFDDAYTLFKQIMGNLDTLMEGPKQGVEDLYLLHFDAFALFEPLIQFNQLVRETKKRFSSLGKLGLDKIKLSDTIKSAYQEANEEGRANLELVTDLEYNPVLETHGVQFRHWLRDLIYNADQYTKGAESPQLEILCQKPSFETKTEFPYLNQIAYNMFPLVYLRLNDNGQGMAPEQVEKNNAYLRGEIADSRTISTRTEREGGGGSDHFRTFLELHNGHAIYESDGRSGTTIHVYLERLEL
jgi:hypothetical protein